jgi:hypothetical protein
LEKKIFIHVGPPKSGTSAVQKWFSENMKMLRGKGVYYPPHMVDQNGVSSGNVRSIYDIDNENQIKLNLERLGSLLVDFTNSNCHTLFLSSEFFFRGMLDLKANIPDAKFIAYLRNPMEIKESSYNQSVKRHFQQRILNAGRSKRLPYMDRFVNYINQYGSDDLNLRLYGPRYFENGNIVSDILHQLGVNLNIDLPLINTSYQFEALEFKRWFNQFELEQYQVIVDRSLQAYNLGCSDYSLILNEKYRDDSCYYAELIKAYAVDLNTKDLAPLIEDMQDASPKPYFKQELTYKAFSSVCHYLQASLKVDYYLLTRAVGKVETTQNDAFRNSFINSCESKYKFLFWISLVRSKARTGFGILKRKVKQFSNR